MAKSCSDSTIKQYNVYLKKWIEFCKNNSVTCTSMCEINNVLNFLFKLYEGGLGYSGCNTARSALSLILKPIDNVSVGIHPLIVRFMKAVSNCKPPKPRYESIWDVSIMLNLFKSWEDNKKLELKELSYKLVSLLALTTGQRAQTLSSILVSNIKGSTTKEIIITAKLKTSSITKPNPILYLSSYKKCLKLCVVKCMDEYLLRTRDLRKDIDNLFISFKSPYSAVSQQTISRWLKASLELAGVDTSIYKGHSFRHASTSKAASNAVNFDVIFSRAGWSKGSKTFAKFYNRPIDDRCTFIDSVLK